MYDQFKKGTADSDAFLRRLVVVKHLTIGDMPPKGFPYGYDIPLGFYVLCKGQLR
jgi:hypothetical protein